MLFFILKVACSIFNKNRRKTLNLKIKILEILLIAKNPRLKLT